jgi:SagB-type dehydrogenase family enzyme
MDDGEFKPEWEDQPHRHKVYPGVVRFPLPLDPPWPTRPLTPELFETDTGRPGDPAGADGFPLAKLSSMLRHSYGLLGRRLRINGNQDNEGRPWYRNATWWRGTAAGGGLYPLEIYWVTSGGDGVLPGIYRYSAPHHSMDRLLVGDVVGHVAAAVDRGGVASPSLADSEQYLLVSVKFWKNSFKYNNFCYHVVTMDLGALLGTWGLWSAAAGTPVRTAMWFDEIALNDLLGLDTTGESVMAVVPLPAAPAADGRPRPSGADRVDVAPRVVRTEAERSRKVVRFPLVEDVHRACLSTETPAAGRPTLADADIRAGRSGGDPIALSVEDRPDEQPGITEVLRSRRSSFGRFSASTPLTVAELSRVLRLGGHGRHLGTDVRGLGDAPRLTRLGVFVNHVAGLEPGAYEYDPVGHALYPVPGAAVGLFLQRNYFLDNYNVEQAGAVLCVLGRPTAAVDTLGDRGYRVVNAEVGAVAETVYLAAAALGLSCGAALGFDNVSYRERLGLVDTDQWPLLILMIGRDRADTADIDQKLF